MARFTGQYRHERDEGFQEFLEKLGVGGVRRKLASTIHPVLSIDIDDDDTWTLGIKTKLNSGNITFKLGKETEIKENGLFNDSVVVFSIDGSKLFQKPVDPKAKNAVEIIREFTDEYLIQTMVHLNSGTTTIRYFKREPKS